MNFAPRIFSVFRGCDRIAAFYIYWHSHPNIKTFSLNMLSISVVFLFDSITISREDVNLFAGCIFISQEVVVRCTLFIYHSVLCWSLDFKPYIDWSKVKMSKASSASSQILPTEQKIQKAPYNWTNPEINKLQAKTLEYRFTFFHFSDLRNLPFVSLASEDISQREFWSPFCFQSSARSAWRVYLLCSAIDDQMSTENNQVFRFRINFLKTNQVDSVYGQDGVEKRSRGIDIRKNADQAVDSQKTTYRYYSLKLGVSTCRVLPFEKEKSCSKGMKDLSHSCSGHWITYFPFDSFPSQLRFEIISPVIQSYRILFHKTADNWVKCQSKNQPAFPPKFSKTKKMPTLWVARNNGGDVKVSVST